MRTRLSWITAIATLLTACGSNTVEQPQSQPPATQTVLDPLLQQRDRAKQQTEAAVEERRRQLDTADSLER